jgi:outer membrane protein TolC
MVAGSTLAHADSGSSLILSDAVQEALKDSPVLQGQQASVDQSGWRAFQALGGGFLPRISAGYTHYFTEKYQDTAINFGGTLMMFPGAYPTNNLTVTATLPIFDGLSNIFGYQAASLEKSAAEQDYDYARFQLAQDVKLAFFQALAASQLRAVAQENVKTLEDHLKEVEVQRSGGAATRYDTLRVSVQLSEARADEIDAEDNGVLARQKLMTLMGLDHDARTLVGELPVPDTTHAKDLELNGVPSSRSDLQALDSRSRAADKMRIARNAWLVPSVSLIGQYDYYELMNENTADGSVKPSGTYKNAYNVGVSLTWNLFDGGVALAQARQASYERIKAEKTAEAARIQVPYDFTFWKKRFLSNTDHYQARKLDIERSEESVRLAKIEERAGTRTSTETLDAELDLFRSKAGAVNAQVSALEAQIKLESALGRTL